MEAGSSEPEFAISGKQPSIILDQYMQMELTEEKTETAEAATDTAAKGSVTGGDPEPPKDDDEKKKPQSTPIDNVSPMAVNSDSVHEISDAARTK